MPDWEKVIRGLRCCRNIHVGATLEDSCNQCPYQKEKGRTCVADELFHDALALLKAQEPRTVLFISKVHEGMLGNCPTCGADLMDYYNEEHCGRCAQAVKWE